MGRNKEILDTPHLVVIRQRLGIGHIGCARRNLTGLESLNQIFLVHNLTSCNVHQISILTHQLEAFSVE